MTSKPQKIETRSTDTEVALDLIIPDPNNRDVGAEAEANGDDWQQFVDSIRVRGILQRLEVCDRGDGTYDLIDGERRWRGAKAAPLAVAPVRIWPFGTSRSELVELGLLINVQRREHGCLEIGRRIRELKNQYALTNEQLAQRLGLKVAKVKDYLQLFEASDDLLTFFAEEATSLRVAVELVRFQKKHGDVNTRRLLARAADEAMTVALVQDARKNLDGKRTGAKDNEQPAGPPRGRRTFAASLATALEKDSGESVVVMQAVLAPRGYFIVQHPGGEGALRTLLEGTGVGLVCDDPRWEAEGQVLTAAEEGVARAP